MSHTLAIVLLLVSGAVMTLVVLVTSSVLFACYILESARRILRRHPTKP